MFFNAAIAAAILSTVAAHQNFDQFWVNGVSPGYQKAIRMPPSNSPVTDVTSDDITCNVNGNIVPSGVSTFAANEGDSIEVHWTSSGHPGPITHFLYGPVANASTATGVGSWYKINEFDSSNGTWASIIMEDAGMTYNFTLPTGLESGDYLLRSEMLALHGSTVVGGGQFYIGCAQLTITGTGGGCTPSIELPGAYSATDTDIYISNFYYGFDISTYTAPGGAVATCGSGSGSTTATTTAALLSSTSIASSTVIASSVATPALEVAAVSSTPSPSAAITSAPLTSAASSSKVTSAASAPVVVASSSTKRKCSSVYPTTLATKASSLIASSTAAGVATSKTSSVASSGSTSGSTSGSVALYGQCGGTGWTGATTCATGTCTVQNPYYSQCIN